MSKSRARQAFLTALCLVSTATAKPFVFEPGYLETVKSHSTVSTAASATKAGETYRVFHLEFADEASAKAFAPKLSSVFHRAGRFVDLFAQPTDKALEEIASAPNLSWLDYNRSVTVPEPPQAKPVAASRGSAENVVKNGYEGLTGKGVTLAVVDTGFDVRHPDFQTVGPDGETKTRFSAIWDTTETRPGFGTPAPFKYPNGESIGVIYSRDEINAYLAKPEGARPDITWDRDGHGTACAGIAAGNGRAWGDGRYAGVASQAELIGVRLGDQSLNTYLLPAILDWLDQKAGARPLVISNSWGGHRSGHDGSTIVERQMDERFPAERQGRLVLFAAGNEGQDRIHAGGEYAGADKPGVLAFPKVAEGDEAEVSIYFDSADSGLEITPKLETHSYKHGVTGQIVWRFQVTPGLDKVEISSKSGKPGHFDAYISGTIKDTAAVFEPGVATFEELVCYPGNAENVLTVGSYDFNPFFEKDGNQLRIGVEVPESDELAPMTIGDVSGYSSPGLTRLGRLKPDFTAPGQWWTAAGSADVEDKALYETSGRYTLFNGTSAATPYSAGVMALKLEKNPKLTLSQVRALMDKHLKEDPFTGSLPNPTWGRGKLSLPAITAILKEI